MFSFLLAWLILAALLLPVFYRILRRKRRVHHDEHAAEFVNMDADPRRVALEQREDLTAAFLICVALPVTLPLLLYRLICAAFAGDKR